MRLWWYDDVVYSDCDDDDDDDDDGDVVRIRAPLIALNQILDFPVLL